MPLPVQLGKGQAAGWTSVREVGKGFWTDGYGMSEAGGGGALWEEEMEDGSKQPVLACQTVWLAHPSPAASLMFTLLNILLTSCSVTVSNASSLLAGVQLSTMCLRADTEAAASMDFNIIQLIILFGVTLFTFFK